MTCKSKRIISILIASGILLSPNNIQAMENTVSFINEDLISTENTNIVDNSVYEIVLSDGEFVPNLTNNPKGYQTIKVKTIGNKKLVKQDYDNLRYSRIPKVDLSQSKSDSIPDRAFYSSSALKEFKFPKGVTSIGDEAFMSCSGLTGNLELPETLISIGNYAFYSCSSLYGNLNLPKSLISIGNDAFVSCIGFNGDLVIPDSVKTIGNSAFTYCDGFNGTLKLSKSLKSIGSNAFMALKGFNGDLIIPDSVEFIGEAAFSDCTGFSGDLVLPNSIKNLSDGVFMGCSGFKGKLKLPDNIQTIGFATFNGCCGLSGNLILPNTLKAIGNRAFRDCTGFSGDLVIPDSVGTIGSYCFNGCKGLNGKLKLGNSLTDIGIGAFYECSELNGELKLPNSLNNIGMYAFNRCSGFSGNLILPNSLISLGNNAFKGTNIDKTFIKVNSQDKDTNYRKSVIDNLPTNSEVIIDIPYDFDISKTWLQNTDKTIVKPLITKSTSNWTNKDVSITLNTSDNIGIEKIILPDNSEVNVRNITYKVSENGDYKFIIVDECGDKEEIIVNVNNIDKESPSINYNIIEDRGNSIIVELDMKDSLSGIKSSVNNKGIAPFDGNKFELMKNIEYIFTATDNAGNTNTINILKEKNGIDNLVESLIKIEDIQGHWAESEILSFINKGYVNGYLDGTFKPNKSITRAEFIKLVNRVLGYNKKGTENFSDVNHDEWYYDDVCIAVNAGYVDGYLDGTFKPNNPITREEVACIITNIQKCKDSNLDKIKLYKDNNQISQWAQSSVEGAIEKGYMGVGLEDFRPKDNITRAEAVVTLSRIN